MLLTETNSIPGWTFEGTVRYVMAGPNMSLPGNGHAIQLGPHGKISQTFRATKEDYDYYVLTITLAPGLGQNCSISTTVAVNISVPGVSRLFTLEKRYGTETWESHSLHLGGWGGRDDDELVNLVIRSQPTDWDSDNACGPVVDTFLLKRLGMPGSYGGT
uniref:DUF642 domain-containing protein n=1 Tax=Nelumbo nucifera TaxID=4432 RepID=A0A822YRQ8_NELNU|nr:TPA_asm: hypothetical protein HUJ06_004901 [Nelumbo nucifera]